MKKIVCIIWALCLCLSLSFVLAEDADRQDWYTEKALEMAALTEEAVRCDRYLSLVAAADLKASGLDRFQEIRFDLPQKTEVIFPDVQMEKIISIFFDQEENGDAVLSPAMTDFFSARLLKAIPSMLSSSAGTEFLALSSILSAGSAWPCPDDIRKDAYAVLSYEGDCSLIVTFNRLSTGVMEASTMIIPAEQADRIKEAMAMLPLMLSSDAQ